MILLIVCWKFSGIMANEVGNPEGSLQATGKSLIRSSNTEMVSHSFRASWFSGNHCITLLAEFITAYQRSMVLDDNVKLLVFYLFLECEREIMFGSPRQSLVVFCGLWF